MATIPIEVIVQDAEAPIVPSEDGTNNTETNVTVPDTGTISSSGDTSSSASSIILPAILLALAIGSIVAILIHKYHKQKKDKTSKKEKLAMAITSTIAVLAATVLISNLVLPATKAATSDITDAITPAEDKVSIVVTRDGGPAEASVESTATITSTSDFGYKVLLSMAEGVETSNLYLNGDTTSKHYIASTEDATLADNTWGYALTEDSEYSAVPLLDDAVVVAEGDEPVEDELLSIYYGVKVSSDLPAGTYSGGKIEYILEAKEPTLPITYMQDLATLSEEDKTALISSMPEGYQFTLKDSRDQKDYFISKLADGNIWMTQNLDFSIVNGGTDLNSTNTDVPTDWADASNLTNTYAADDTTWNWSSTAPESYDPGNLYWNGTFVYNRATCEEYGGTWRSYGVCDGANPTSATGDTHYHVGNYYNWTAAIAMRDSSDYSASGETVNQSICPAGWTLPLGDPEIGAKSFQALVIQYGWTDSSQMLGNDKKMWDTPLYYVLGGVWVSYFQSSGTNGGYWSSVIENDTQAHFLELSYKGNVSPVSTYGKGGGLFVRCLAK